MRAAESRLSGGTWKGRGGNPAAALSSFVSALFAGLPLAGSPLGPALRKLILIAVAVSLAFAPLPVALAGGGTESVHHASLAEQEASDHGHSHEDSHHEGEAAGHSAAHQHGHDPADHSHHYVFLTGGSSQWGLPPAQRWPSALSGRPDAAMGFGIERPPKRVKSL